MQRLFYIFIFLAIIAIPANAAIISGKTIDANTGEPLVGCTIKIIELHKVAVSGLDGSFIIKGIPVGTYSISASLMSFKTIGQVVSITNENDHKQLEFAFLPANNSLNEVTIISKHDNSSEISALQAEHHANNIINVVSARTIELSPDLNVANVIQRMSGVAIENSSNGSGQYAILRGMDKRYSYTLVNGIKIPSTDNKYRYLPLDLFPSDMVNRLEITKTLTPAMESDAIGGAVNMVMKDAPENLQIKANAAIGYSQIFTERHFMTFSTEQIQQKTKYELLGSSYKATENDFPKENLNIKPKSFVPNQVAGLFVGNRFFDKKLGIMIAGNYLKNYRGSNSLFFDVISSADEKNLPKLSSKENRQYSDEQTQYGIHNKFDYRLNNRHTLKLYNVFISAENKQIRDLNTIEFNSYEPGNGTYTKNYETRNRYNIQQINNSTLQGEHLFSDKFKINWSGVFSKASNQSPDQTKISLVSDIKDFQEQHVYVVEKSCTRRWTRNNDQDLATYIDINYAPMLFAIPLKLAVGGLYRNKQRTSFYNQYTLIPVSDRQAPFEHFSEKGVDWNTYSEIRWEILNPPDPTHPLNYDASEKIWSNYFQFDFLIRKIQWIGGLRAEHTNQGYILHYEQYGSKPIGNQSYTDFLPSLYVKYMPTAKQNFRISYYRAINRPGFLEIVPYEDKTDEYTEAGNARLKRTIADNFDLRYEYFPKNLDQLMAGIFYKEIRNPVEYSFVEKGATKSIIYMPENFGTARNFGIEIDARKYLRHWGVVANYTWTHSRITTPKLLLQRDEAGNLVKTFPVQSRPLYGQAGHTANISILYKNTRLGWDAQLAASYTSDRIAIVSQYIDNDTWEKGSVKLDLSSEKKISKTVNMFIKIRNLLNTPKEQYLKKNNPEFAGYPGQYTNSNKTLVRKDYEMTSFLLGIRYKFN